MIDIVKLELRPSKTRLGILNVKYYDLTILCELCLYKDEKLWIRMPGFWVNNDKKVSYVYWEDKSKSDEFQKETLKKVFDMIGFGLPEAIQMRKDFFIKKRSDKNEK